MMTLRALRKVFGSDRVRSNFSLRRVKSRKPLRFDWLEARTLLNNAPWAGDDGFSTMHDTPLSITAPGVLANDGDMDGDPLSFSVVSGPSSGAISGLSNDGSFAYSPNASFTGTDTFTYKVNDGLDDSTVATVTITVMTGPLPPPETCGDSIDNNYDGQIDEGCPLAPSSNTTPTAGDDSFGVTPDSTLSVSAPGLLGNDSDMDGNPLTISLVAGPGHGTLSGPNANGSFSYAPDTGFVGIDFFTYKLNDGMADSNSATVTITVSTSEPGFLVVNPLDSAIENAVFQAFAVYNSTMDHAQADHDAIVQAELQYQHDTATAHTAHDNALAAAASVRNSDLAAAQGD